MGNIKFNENLECKINVRDESHIHFCTYYAIMTQRT